MNRSSRVNPSRFPIFIFALIGLLFVLTSDVLLRGLMDLAHGPHRRVAGILAQVWNWSGPGLWVLVLALCLFLTTGSARPIWTRGNWPLAVAVLYLFHTPLMAFAPPLVFGRWGFTVYLILGSVGAVFAIWLLTKSFHVAAFFLLAEPVVRNVSWGYVHHAARSVMMALFSVIGWALIGWWFGDADTSHRSQSTTVPPLATTPGTTGWHL